MFFYGSFAAFVRATYSIYRDGSVFAALVSTGDLITFTSIILLSSFVDTFFET